MNKTTKETKLKRATSKKKERKKEKKKDWKKDRQIQSEPPKNRKKSYTHSQGKIVRAW